MVAEVVTQLVCPRLVHQHVGGDAVYLEFVTQIVPLFLVQAVVQALDVRNHGLVFHDGRGLVGNVNPYEVVTFQVGGLERFVGLDGRTARSTITTLPL